MDKMETQLFTPVETRLDIEKKAVGNSNGLSLLDRLDAVEDELKLIERRLDTYLSPIRSFVLDTWSNIRPDDRNQKNSITDGGNVIEDFYLIIDMMKYNRMRGLAWRAAFEANYEVSFEFCRNSFGSCHLKILKVLNIIVTVKNSWWWTDPSSDDIREDILVLCRKVVQLWKDGSGPLFEENSLSLSLYGAITALYASH